MRTCEHCQREISVRGKAPKCPFCGWRQGSPRYWLEKKPETIYYSKKDDRRFVASNDEEPLKWKDFE